MSALIRLDLPTFERPTSTTSGSYTLWVYYPSLTSQTLYTAINDFIEPKLKQIAGSMTALRNKGSARSRDDERQFEALQAFEKHAGAFSPPLLRRHAQRFNARRFAEELFGFLARAVAPPSATVRRAA